MKNLNEVKRKRANARQRLKDRLKKTLDSFSGLPVTAEVRDRVTTAISIELANH